MKASHLNILFAACAMLAVSFSARANMPVIENPTQHEKVAYTIRYLGLDVGKIWLWWEENDAFYKVTSLVKTSGIARMLSKQKRTVELFGKKEKGQLVPLRYNSHVEYPNKEKSVSMLFDNGHIVSYRTVPDNDTVLSDEQQYAAKDPLSVLLSFMHHATHAPKAAFPFTTTSFDGKRLNRIYALPTIAPDLCDSPSCLAYSVFRTPLAGYNAKKMEKYKKGEPPVFMSVRPENSHFPEQLNLDTLLGGLYILRTQDED